MALFSSATTFLSRGLSRGDKAGTRRVSALLRLTTIGVALSLSVMLLSVTIILGFHRQIHEFAFSQTGHISLNGYGSNWKTSTTPVYVSPELLSFLREEKGGLFRLTSHPAGRASQDRGRLLGYSPLWY